MMFTSFNLFFLLQMKTNQFTPSTYGQHHSHNQNMDELIRLMMVGVGCSSARKNKFIVFTCTMGKNNLNANNIKYEHLIFTIQNMEQYLVEEKSSPI